MLAATEDDVTLQLIRFLAVPGALSGRNSEASHGVLGIKTDGGKKNNLPP